MTDRTGAKGRKPRRMCKEECEDHGSPCLLEAPHKPLPHICQYAMARLNAEALGGA